MNECPDKMLSKAWSANTLHQGIKALQGQQVKEEEVDEELAKMAADLEDLRDYAHHVVSRTVWPCTQFVCAQELRLKRKNAARSPPAPSPSDGQRLGYAYTNSATTPMRVLKKPCQTGELGTPNVDPKQLFAT